MPADAVAPGAAPRRKLTPIWTLKASQCLGAAAFACLAKYLPVYYSEIGLDRNIIGILGFTNMGVTFIGQIFWSVVIDRLGEYKSVLVGTQFFGTVSLMFYCLPVVQNNLVLIFIVACSNTFMMSTGGSIIDALCMKVLKEYKIALRPDSTPRTVRGAQASYGEMRLYSAVGWGGMSMVMGQVIDMLGLDFMFVGFGLIQACNVSIVVLFMPTPTKEEVAAAAAEAEQAAGAAGEDNANKSLLNFSVVWFFLNLFFYGIAMCLIENFLFVYLVEEFENATKFILGASTAIMCLFEIPVFHWVGPWLENQPIGNERALTIVLFACQVITAVRCWLYAIIPGNMIWIVLVIGILQGASFAAMWVASMEYAKRLSNHNNLAKMTSLVNGIYYSLSMGFGSLLWGVLVEKPPKGLGFRASFFADVYFICAWAVIWGIGLWLMGRRQVAVPGAREGLTNSGA